MLISKRHVKTIFIYSILSACLFFIIQQEWLIWLGPQFKKTTFSSTKTHKEIHLYYWKHDQWQDDTIQSIWVNNSQQNIHYITNHLLTLLYEEGIISQIITAETVIINQSESEAFISFDRKPFKKNSPIITKTHLLEALCKTIAPLYPLQKIHFFVKHKPLEDPHIDCSIGWPV